MLAQAQAALLEHEAALESHAENVRGHESYVQRHERGLATQHVQAGSEASRDAGNLAFGIAEQTRPWWLARPTNESRSITTVASGNQAAFRETLGSDVSVRGDSRTS